MQWQAPANILRWTCRERMRGTGTLYLVRAICQSHSTHTQMFYYVYTFIYATLLAHTHTHLLIAYNGLFPEFRLVCMKYTKHKHKFKLHIKISTIYTIARNERKIRTGNRQSVAPTTTKAAATATQSAQNRRTSSSSDSNISNILQFEIYFSFWCHKILMVKM